jgi:uncharacterized protein YukE
VSTGAGNPLVATAKDSGPDAWAGVWIAEDIQAIANGVSSGSWVDATLGGVSAGLDALALVSDPIGALLQYGVAWIIEHVRPLSEALDWLAGDPAQIAAHAQTWRNVAQSLRADVEELAGAVRRDVGDWGGSAGPAYRQWASEQQQAIGALAAAADTMAAITEGAGVLVAGVRLLVRDAIATLVSRLISYALEEIASLGLATPWVVEQVSTLCAAWAAKISRWLKGLIDSLRSIGRYIDELKPPSRTSSNGSANVSAGANRAGRATELSLSRAEAIAHPSRAHPSTRNDSRNWRTIRHTETFRRVRSKFRRLRCT